MNLCKICGKPAGKPFRRIIQGDIVEGCISAFHTGHLEPGGADDVWHNRTASKSWRAASKWDFDSTTGKWSK